MITWAINKKILLVINLLFKKVRKNKYGRTIPHPKFFESDAKGRKKCQKKSFPRIFKVYILHITFFKLSLIGLNITFDDTIFSQFIIVKLDKSVKSFYSFFPQSSKILLGEILPNSKLQNLK